MPASTRPARCWAITFAQGSIHHYSLHDLLYSSMAYASTPLSPTTIHPTRHGQASHPSKLCCVILQGLHHRRASGVAAGIQHHSCPVSVRMAHQLLVLTPCHRRQLSKVIPAKVLTAVQEPKHLLIGGGEGGSRHPCIAVC